MRLGPLALAIGVVTAAGPGAWAQMQLVSTQSLPLESMAAGAGRQLTMKGLASGLKLGETALLHAGLSASFGYDTNVFYGPGGLKPAAVMYVSPRLELTNAERDGSIPQGTYYYLTASVDWRKYLTSDDTITQQDALNPSVAGVAEFSSGQVVAFTLSDTFSRYQQAPWSVGEPITRDQNMASAGLRYAPGGGRLRLTLRYANLLDKYEGLYDGGSNMGNEFTLDVAWRFLPKTSLYVQVAQGLISYFNNDVRSYPLRTLAGLRGLITEKLSLNLGAGYSNAFYSLGDNPSGFGNVGLVGEIGYQIDILSRTGIGYRHDFANSPFVGGYYSLDAVYAVYQQMIASRVVAYLYGRYENRRFGNSTERTDNYLVGGVSVDYMIRNFFLLGASYSLYLNRSEQPAPVAAPGVPSPPTSSTGFDYTKHLLLFRLGVVY